MREPGARRRNPLFDSDADSDARSETDGGAGRGADAGPRGGRRGDAVAGAPGIESAVTDLARALQGAQPEAAEHLVAAAHELVLAVKTVVDAAESSLSAQRSALAAARQAAADPGAEPLADPDFEPAPRAGPAPRARPPRVRPIDLA